jgi:hypothetical protein
MIAVYFLQTVGKTNRKIDASGLTDSPGEPLLVCISPEDVNENQEESFNIFRRAHLICGLVAGLAIGSVIAGVLFPSPIFSVGDDPYSAAIGDFDGDGRQDLAVANLQSNDISVLLNQLPMIVETDIMPDSINPRSRGIVPVALLGSDDLEVADVDVTTLRFGPAEAAPAHDLTNLFTFNDHFQDVNLDGFIDLMTHFPMHDTGITCGDTEVTLTGSLMSGQPIEGTVSFKTVGCRGASKAQRH